MEGTVDEHAEALSRNGIVVIEDYLDDEDCDAIYEEVTEKIESDTFDVVEGGDHNYQDLVNWGGPVANRRTGKDDGMIDVFNVDEAIQTVAAFKDDNFVNELVNRASNNQYSPDNINVYWNRSVTHTRGFHADAYSGQFKSFVYLTDVPDRSYGPFSYVKGTHDLSTVKTKASQLVNRLRGEHPTDAIFYDDDDVVYCTAPKGTLIIANQQGYHRGYPQEKGRERMLMTTSYTPDT